MTLAQYLGPILFILSFISIQLAILTVFLMRRL